MSQTAQPETYPLEHGPREGESIILLHGGNMGGWTWQGVVENLQGRHLLTPDLPGYGERFAEEWPGLAGAADDVASIIRTHAIGGRAHVVGLSLGGFVATHLIHRHPELALSYTVSGAAVAGYSRFERFAIRMQVPLWHRRWYWAAQAPLFGIPRDVRGLFVTTTSRPSPSTNRAMFESIVAGAMPEGEFPYTGPALAVSAERETQSVRDAFDPLRKALPQLQTWVAPKVHHPWSAENPELFAEMVAAQADSGAWPVRA